MTNVNSSSGEAVGSTATDARGPLFDRDGNDTDTVEPVREPTDDTTRIDPVTDPADAPSTADPGDGTDGPSTDPSDGPGRWRRWAPYWVPVLVLVVAFGAWVGVLMWQRAGTALPGVSVEGVDVSGMDAAAITDELDRIVAQRRDATITATADGQQFTMTLGSEGYEADVDAAVAEALGAGRTGPWSSAVNHVEATFERAFWTFDLETETLQDPIDRFVARIGDEIDTPAFDGSVEIDPAAATVSSRNPRDGIEVVTDDARATVLEVAGTGRDATVDLATRVLEPVTTAAAVTSAVDRIEAALAEPFRLTRGDDAITIEPSEFATWLSVGAPDSDFAVELDQQALTTALEGRGERFEREAVSAQYRVDSGWRTYDNKGSGTWDPTPAGVSIIEGNTGLAYDHEAAASQVVDLYESGEHSAELELEVTEPRLTNERARQLRPDALLGTFTTYEICCDNREHNIRRLADLVDGAMLLPGENYSVNDSVGPRTADKGFLPAGTIIEGELEDSVGGGISQTATTFYNAAFFAGIEVLEHRPHSWPISRYPLAREATFSYAGDLDINILNDTEGALIVTTRHGEDSVTFSIFGKDDGRTVTAQMGQPHDYTDYDTERRPTDELVRGQERVLQSGGRGFTVDYQRIIDGGTTAGTENYSWTYPPKTEIIEYGTREPQGGDGSGDG